MHTLKNSQGFTLIEIVITIAIVAIIASVAIPGYQDQIRKARRADVMDLLTDCAAAQARNYSTDSPPTYLTRNQLVGRNLCNGDGANPNTLMSKDGYYSITQVRNQGCTTAGPAGNTRWCFLLIATPVAGSTQATDTACQQWTIDHADNKTAQSDDGTDTSAQCWRT